MSSISYLNNRQIGDKYKSGSRKSNLNLDHVLSRLVCYKQDFFTIHGEESDVPPFACKFRKDAHSNLLAIANEDGDISLYDTTKRYPESKIKSFVAHHNAVFDICWMPDKCQLISVSGDHNAALWDITSYQMMSVFRKHTSSVKSIDICHQQSAIFVTGSRDGCVNIWDTRDKDCCINHKPAVVINFAHCRRNTFNTGKKLFVSKDPISSVSAVAFQDSNNVATAGVADGIVKVWDLRRTYVSNSKYLPSPKYQMNYSEPGAVGHGCTSLVFDSSHKTLYGCMTNNKIMKFNCHSYTKEPDEYEGFRCATYFIKLALSCDDQYLLCGSTDDSSYVWKTSKPGLPIKRLAIHSAEVTSVCWSPYDITKLVTCGDDNKVAIWKVAETEISNIHHDILAVAEPFSGAPKNENSVVTVIAQNSTTVSNVPVKKKSPVILNHTPNKPAVRSITSFFSPITPTSASTPIRSTQNNSTVNNNKSPNSSNKLINKNPETHSQVLTPYNHKNSTSHLNISSDDNTGTLSSLDIKNSSAESKNSSSFSSPSLSVQNKENSNKHISPEMICNKKSSGQTKRKISKHSTSNLKRKQTESSKKTKGHVKQDKKITSGKTIMNYFSVTLSPDN